MVNRLGFGNADVFVGGAVVEEIAALLFQHSFNENDIGNLADFLPIFFRGEDGSVGTREEFAGIVTVEDSDGGAIDELVVGAVVDEDDAALSEDGRGAGLDNAGVKHADATRKDRSFRGFGPVNEIVRV